MLTTGSPTSHVDFAGRPLSPPPESSRESSHPHRSRPPSWSHHPGDGVPRSSSRSPLMPGGPQNYESSFPKTQSPPAQTSLAHTAASLCSPPSSLTMSAQNSQHPTSATNSFPTPASSVSGQMATAAPEDGDGTTKDSTSSVEVTRQEGDASIKNENSPDHMEIDAAAPPEESNKQPSDAQESKVTENAMELDPKETKPTSDPTLGSLQTDMGQVFHLCKTSYSMSGPDPSLDLVSLYGLGPAAESVARTDPNTGGKGKRLRKSYEGKIKEFGLAGRNKPAKHESGTSGGLRQLTLWPEEEWQNQKVYGKEIKAAEPDSNAYKMQMRAMKLEPGPVPNNEYWESVLGHEKQPSVSTATTEPSRKPSAPTPTFQQPSQANGTPSATTPVAGDPGRPKRAGKKRSYTDDSFVGYADAFAEDEDLEGSMYSNSEAGSSKKKRKKDHLSGVPQSLGDRGGSYGVGMFGVGAR